MSITVTAKELATLLDLASNAPAKIGDGYHLYHLITKFVTLSNSRYPIGEIVPVPVNCEPVPVNCEPVPSQY